MELKLKDSATATYSAEPPMLTISILKDGVMDILKKFADMRLIRLEDNLQMSGIINSLKKPKINWRKYEGAMSKQPLEDVDKQLAEFRKEH